MSSGRWLHMQLNVIQVIVNTAMKNLMQDSQFAYQDLNWASLF
jgi:hypothetical protein